jgi:hypothetical protein
MKLLVNIRLAFRACESYLCFLIIVIVVVGRLPVSQHCCNSGERVRMSRVGVPDTE